MKPTAPPPSLRDLLLRSDLGRADPRRVDELLRAATPASPAATPRRETVDAAD